MDSLNKIKKDTPSDTITSSDTSASTVVTPSGNVVSSSSSQSAVVTSTPSKAPMWVKLVLILLIVIAAGLAVVVASRLSTNKPTLSSAPNHYAVSKLRIGIYEGPFSTQWYPNINYNDFPLISNNLVFEGLTTIKNQTQIVPDLATNWTNPNDTTWVFTLAQGVKFHDGTTMTATQVAASINDNLTNPLDESYTTDIKTAVATDPDTVTITTTQPDAILTKQLTQIWIYDTSSSTPDSASTGTGPYELKAGSTFTGSSMQLTAYPDYHGTKPIVQEIDFDYYPTVASQLAALKAGQLDLADLAESTLPSTISTVKADGYTLFTPEQAIVYDILPNTLEKNSPLSNLMVRQAIYDGLNPSAIASARGDTPIIASQLVPQIIPGYNPAIIRPAQNITKAKQLLAQAGYPNGFTTSFSYFSPQEDPTAKAVQSQMAAIGITLTLDPITSPGAFESQVASGNIDLFFEGVGSSIIDTSDVAGETVIDTPEFSNPTIDSLFNQASQTFNASERLKLLQQLNTDVMNDLAVFPLYQPTGFPWAVRPGLVVDQSALASNYALDYPYVYSTIK